LGGANGGPNKRTGRHGKNVYLEVPVGTVVKEIWKGFDEETGDVTEGVVKEHDLDEEGAFVVGASGGRGGRGNQYMVKSESEAKEYFRRQRERREEEGEEDGGFEIPGLEGFVFDNEADREQFDFLLEDGGGLEAKKKLPNEGEVGEQRYYELELKLIADVGLVGYPNAGKSTLLGALSRAKPKVAPYPFTTLHPFVGTVEFADAYRFLVADTPGLIDGAHENIGLGHQFLRHIERNKILAFVIDISDEHGPKAGDALTALERELNLYAPGLGDQDAVILANKIDVPTSKESFQRDQYESLQAASKGRPIFPISAKESNGVDRVVLHLRSMLETQEDREQAS
jgi:GTP-binding protein